MVNDSQNLPESETKGQSEGETSFLVSSWGSVKNAIVGCGAAVIFGLAVLLASILSVSSPQAAGPEVMAITSEPVVVAVEYYLPYPGVLPDSPLYKIKAARDWVILGMTFDEAGKAEKELLYADKRINAALALIEGNKVGVGVSTATKAEKYLESAVNRVIKLSGEGKDVKSLLLTLSKATAKHVEVLEGLDKRVTGPDGGAIGVSLKLARALAEKVTQAVREMSPGS